MKKLITAKTSLRSNTGNYYSFMFEVFWTETDGFKKAKILKKGPCDVRPWILLDLLSEIFSDVIPQKKEYDVQFVHNDSEYASHPALEVKSTGQRYRLDKIVNPSWLYNPNIMDFVSYWKYFRPCFESMYNEPCHKWLYWIEDLS